MPLVDLAAIIVIATGIAVVCDPAQLLAVVGVRAVARAVVLILGRGRDIVIARDAERARARVFAFLALVNLMSLFLARTVAHARVVALALVCVLVPVRNWAACVTERAPDRALARSLL